MPGRNEFEHEVENEAETTVKEMVFDDPMDTDEELKLAVLDIYNDKLTTRSLRKMLIFERQLLDFKKVQVGCETRVWLHRASHTPDLPS